eukprot:TRINITY_DN7903_c0_g1_i1.p1 TRINITY_DN7903_c0_g1~~TRINITY_DN7903_c0_g1_i1.p1  ORF type:complete len:230 (+),score=32.25 TRINITY_DN7903_c0_g1_i1:324-1013(+)
MNLVILFSNLPQLMFHGAIIVTGLMWDFIVKKVKGPFHHTITTTLMTYVSWFNLVTLFMFFVALSVAFAVLRSHHSSQFNCSTPVDQRNSLTDYEVVSLTYKALFAFYSVIIALIFLFQGSSIIILINTIFQTPDKGERKYLRLASTYIIVTITSVCGLLAQAAVSIYTVIADLENVSKLIIIITCEWLPTVMLAYLMRPGTFTRHKSSQSPSPTNLQGSSHKTPNAHL